MTSTTPLSSSPVSSPALCIPPSELQQSWLLSPSALCISIPEIQQPPSLSSLALCIPTPEHQEPPLPSSIKASNFQSRVFKSSKYLPSASTSSSSIAKVGQECNPGKHVQLPKDCLRRHASGSVDLSHALEQIGLSSSIKVSPTISAPVVYLVETPDDAPPALDETNATTAALCPDVTSSSLSENRGLRRYPIPALNMTDSVLKSTYTSAENLRRLNEYSGRTSPDLQPVLPLVLLRSEPPSTLSHTTRQSTPASISSPLAYDQGIKSYPVPRFDATDSVLSPFELAEKLCRRLRAHHNTIGVIVVGRGYPTGLEAQNVDARLADAATEN
ncbi:hypothetical protein BDV98DRAFT_586026 [Pterulicium gracile]|uniref:Uncharacterized protein n=1 Tax=Pterulicium gracile TaxID=1884261 RepID=A0A5C3Q6Y3_9AGAR|nr:hypothetical protein BDV98DRAFT_586026 [Pterula gracilis]